MDDVIMRRRAIIDHVFAEPFRPFRVHTVSGRTFEVRHPDFFEMGRSTLTVYTVPEGDPEGDYHWESLSLGLIESIAPIDASVGPSGS
jgi:hypothetical protein